jgi:hypothetical protein
MLYLDDATTPKKTLLAVIEFLEAEALRFESQSKSMTKLAKEREMVKSHVLRSVKLTLSNSNVMLSKKE